MDLDNKFLLLPEEDTGIYVQPVSVAIAWAEPSITDFQPLLGHEEASTGLRFSLIRKLGCGSQGFVLLMRDERRGELVAIKYCSKDIPNKSRAKYMAREVLNHQELSLFAHPHIVQLYEVFLTSRYVAMAMEYVDGVDLYSYLNANGGRLSENEARAIFQQLILAVDFCHRIGKGHRDIKLSNILVQTRGTTAPLIKLCDFGFSKDKDDSQPKSTVGTALFFAPEVAISNDSEPYAVEPADTWACGVVLYMLLFGGHPFLQKVETSFSFFIIKLISNSREGKLTFPEGAEAAMPQAVALIRSILLYHPATRIKIPELMNHPWFLTNLPQNALTLNETLLSKRCSTVNDGWLVAPVEIGQSMLFDELQNQIRTRQQSRLTSKEMDK